MAAPGPPVAKLQCTASLAGARPAGFTSVPGRATVAFGAADPSPGSTAPVYPWSVGKGPPRQDHLAAARAPASVPYKARARSGTRLVAGPRPNPMACPMRTLSVKKQGEVPLSLQGGSGGIPRPFEGGIGGPGGHRGEVGIPPAPLAGGATLQKESHFTIPESKFHCQWSPTPREKSSRNTQKVNFLPRMGKPSLEKNFQTKPSLPYHHTAAHLFPCSLFRGMEPCYNVAAYPMAYEPLPAPCRTSAHKGRRA